MMYKSKDRFDFFPIFFITLLAIFLIVTPVSADDSQPVDTTGIEEVSPTVDETGQTEGTEVAGEVIADPVAEAAEEPVAADEVITETAEGSEPTSEELPADVQETVTEVAIADEVPVEDSAPAEIVEVLSETGIEEEVTEDGSIVSRDAADEVLDGDPYFTVGSTTYYFMHPGGCGTLTNCTESTTPIQDALDYMAANSLVPSDRKLYITADDYDEDVDIDGTLSGVSGLTGLIGDTSGGLPIIYGHVYIHDMPAGFTVSNLAVDNVYHSDDAAIWAWDNKGTLTFQDVSVHASETDSSGIIIEHTGTVVLDRVTANDSAYKGADLMVSGTVTIQNSTFDNNLNDVFDGVYYESSPQYVGLNIAQYSTSAVTLNGVSAQGNKGDGANVDALSSTVSIKNSDFSHSDEGDEIESWGDGLWIIGNKVVLEDIYAGNNNIHGIFSFAKTSFTGTRLFTMGNNDSGLMIDTCDEWGDGICHNPGAGTVTIKGSPSYGNGGHGYDIFAKGAVVFYDVFSGYNGGDGIFIDNGLASSAPITLTKLNIMGNHGYSGLEIYTFGAIKATNVRSNENDNHGIYVEAYGSGAVTFTIAKSDPNAFNETARNGGIGYNILSAGPVSLTSFDSYENQNGGGFIDNSLAAGAAAVKINTLDPKATVSGYINNGAGGLTVFSNGAITVSDISVESNQLYGAYFNNLSAAVTISNSDFSYNCLHDENGCYWSGDLDQHGLEVISRGVITLSNISAQGNYGDGAKLNNFDTTSAPGVVIKASSGKDNEFLWNGGNGLVVLTNGPITTTNLVAVGNGGTGAFLGNNTPGRTSPVKINASKGVANSFLDNGGNGLYINSNGTVTLMNIIARNNQDGYGVNIVNDTGTGSVTIKQSGGFSDYYGYYCNGNCFNENAYSGLFVQTYGNATVFFHQAQNNGGDGLRIDTIKGSITITGNRKDYYENVRDNQFNGIMASAGGNITVKYIDSRYNGMNGGGLINVSGTGSVSITEGYFDGNKQGIDIISRGTVTWKGGSANNNTKYGAWIISYDDLLSGKPVTLTNISTSNNGELGLFIYTKGAVLLTNVESNNNSANNFDILMDESWTDNMSPFQVWNFEAPGSGEVTINAMSSKFTPSIEIYDADWNWMGDAGGSNGSVNLTVSGLTPGETYHIHVMSDQWDGWAYEINIYEGSVEPGTFNHYVDEADGIYINNSEGNKAPVTIKNTAYHAWTSNNSGTNVYIRSNGLVTLYNMDLNDSGGSGLDVYNGTSTSTPGVVITNVNFTNNEGFGATIVTKGPVTLKNGEASNNYNGLVIQNNMGAVTSPITVYDFNVHNNGGDGIYIQSNGNVTFTGVRSSQNGGYGAQVYTPGAFTINKASAGNYNSFGRNSENGLLVYAGGKVTLTRLMAFGNGTWDEDGPTNSAKGIELHNLNPLGTSPVLLKDVYTDGNSGTGTAIYTLGAVTITKMEASDNGGNGLFISQVGSPSSAFAITLTQITANNNGANGISVDALGNVTINKFEASSNGQDGVYIYNIFGTGNVTITNPSGGYVSNQADFNGYAGVRVISNGIVKLTGIEAAGNGHQGVFILNNSSPTGAAVILNGIIARENSEEGIEVLSSGVVTISSSWSTGNQKDGIYIETPADVYISNTAAINNWWAGMYVDLTPGGNLKLTGCTWFGNLRNDSDPFDANLVFLGGGLLTIL